MFYKFKKQSIYTFILLLSLLLTYQNCGNPNMGMDSGVNESPFSNEKVILFSSMNVASKVDAVSTAKKDYEDLFNLPLSGLKVTAYVNDLKRSQGLCKVVSQFQKYLPAPPAAAVIAKMIEPIQSYTVEVPATEATQLSKDVSTDECIVGISNYQDLTAETQSVADFSTLLQKYLPDATTALTRSQSHLNLTTQAKSFLTQEAQALLTSKQGLVNVAIISTGLDLKNTNFDQVSLSVGSNYLNGSGQPHDDHFLGTALSSIINVKDSGSLALARGFAQIQPIRLIPKSMILGDDQMQFTVTRIIKNYQDFVVKNRKQLLDTLSAAKIPNENIKEVQTHFQQTDQAIAKAQAFLDRGISKEVASELQNLITEYQTTFKNLSSFINRLSNPTVTYLYSTALNIVNEIDITAAGANTRYQVALLLQTHAAFNLQIIKAVNQGSLAVYNVQQVQSNFVTLSNVGQKLETLALTQFSITDANRKSITTEIGKAVEQLNTMYGTLTTMAQNYALSMQIIFELRDYTEKAKEQLVNALTPRTMGLGNQEISSAILRAINNGAEVILLGVSGKTHGCDPAIGQALYLGIRNNVTFVIPAGDANSELLALDSSTLGSQSTTSPACWGPMFKGAITVGNVDKIESIPTVARLSNRGSKVVKVAAPAIGVPVLVPGGSRQVWSGTQLAAAQVTAAVAVTKAFHKSRLWNYASPWTIESLVLDGSKLERSLEPAFTSGATLDFDQLTTKLNQYAQLSSEQRIGYGTDSAPTLSERAVASTSTVNQLVITGTDSFVYSNQKIALKALIQYANTSVQKDITDQVTWTSSSSLVQISKAGVVSFLTNSSGRFKITATDPKTGLKASTSVVVQPPVAPVVKLEVTFVETNYKTYYSPVPEVIDVDQNYDYLYRIQVDATDTLGQKYNVADEASYALGLGDDKNAAKPVDRRVKIPSGLHTLWITYKGITTTIKLNSRQPKITGMGYISINSITDAQVVTYCYLHTDIGEIRYCLPDTKMSLKGVAPDPAKTDKYYQYFNTSIKVGETAEIQYEITDPLYGHKITGTYAFTRYAPSTSTSTYRSFSIRGAMPGYLNLDPWDPGVIKSYQFLDENSKVVTYDANFGSNSEMRANGPASQLYLEINEELAKKIAFVEVTFDTGEVKKSDIRSFRTPDFITNYRKPCPEKKLPKDEFVLNTQPKAICLTEAGLKGHPFAAGLGTEKDPYIVCTPTQLGNLSLLTQSYLYAELGQSLDFRDWTSGLINAPAYLSLNGNNYKIANYTFASDILEDGAFLYGAYFKVSNLMMADFYIKAKERVLLLGWKSTISNIKITSFDGRNHLEANTIYLPVINNSIIENLDLHKQSDLTLTGSNSLLSDIRGTNFHGIKFDNSKVSLIAKNKTNWMYAGGYSNEYIFENFGDINTLNDTSCLVMTTSGGGIFESGSYKKYSLNQYNLISYSSIAKLYPYSRSQVKGQGSVRISKEFELSKLLDYQPSHKIFLDTLLKYYPEITSSKFKIATPGITIDPKMDPKYLNLFEQVPTVLPPQATPIALVNPPKDGDQTLYTWTFQGDKVIGYQYKAGPSSQINCADKTDYSGVRFIDQTAQANFEDTMDGEYTLCAVGITSEGLYQNLSEASIFKWKKNNSPPKVEVTNPPLTTTNITAVDMGITGVNVSEYAYKYGALGKVSCLTNVDYGSWTSVTEPLKLDLTKTPNGSYVICLLGKSSTGKLQTNATVVSWNLNRMPPIASLIGVPGSPSGVTRLAVMVRGTGVSQYKYKVSSSSSCAVTTGYSEARPVSVPINADLNDLKIADGLVYLCVIAGDIAGNWQNITQATMASWQKSTQAPTVNLTAVGTLIHPNTSLYSKAGGAQVVGYKYAMGRTGQIDCKQSSIYSGCLNGGGSCALTQPVGVCQVVLPSGVFLGSSNLTQAACNTQCNNLDKTNTATCAWNGGLINQPAAQTCTVTAADKKVLFSGSLRPADCNMQLVKWLSSHAGATATIGTVVLTKPWVSFYASSSNTSGTSVGVAQINIMDPIDLDLAKMPDDNYTICAIGVDIAGNWQSTEKATTISFIKRKPFNCKLETTTINHGSSAPAYLTATVPYGQICQSETRSCTDGKLSGSFSFANCKIEPAADCKLGNTTIKHGASLPAFAANSVLFGQTCQSEIRKCDNGKLSGSYTQETCAVSSSFIVENNKTLTAGQSWGHDGLRLKLELGGDLQLYKGTQVLWSTKANTKLTTNMFKAVLQGDGNLVLYNDLNKANAPYWNTRTNGKGALRLLVKETAPFVELIDAKNESVWSGTGFRLADCVLGDKSILPGSTLTAFQTATVPYGQTCKSETRSCTDGKLSGSFNQPSCKVEPAADCKLGNTTIKHGASRPAFAANSVLFGQTCQSEIRKCDNGKLSGSYTQETCSVSSSFIVENNKTLLATNSWGHAGLRLQMEMSGDLQLYKGTQIIWSTKANTKLVTGLFRAVLQGDGNLVLINATNNNSIPYWNTRTGGKGPLRLLVKETAPFVELIDAKNAVVWSGTGFRLADCVLGNQTILPGSSIKAYQSATVPFGGSCLAEWRNCNDGKLSGSHAQTQCVVNPPADCKLGNSVIKHGNTGKAFQSLTVLPGQTCQSETRACSNGNLSGSYPHSSCEVRAADCKVGAVTIPNGSAKTYYNLDVSSFWTPCQNQNRVCQNGVLSGTYTYESCKNWYDNVKSLGDWITIITGQFF